MITELIYGKTSLLVLLSRKPPLLHYLIFPFVIYLFVIYLGAGV